MNHSPRGSSPGDEFDAGEQEALDPQRDRVQRGGTALTHPSSWWNHRLCGTCRHSFRRGDEVRLSEDGRKVAHLDPELHCATVDKHPAGPGSEDGADEFAAGLLAAWPPLGEVPVVRLDAHAWQIAGPAHGERPPRCLFCGHTFRTGEYVVLCPCRPDDAACGAAVHRDPARGLVCWESWRPDGTLTICPVKRIAVEPAGGAG